MPIFATLAVTALAVVVTLPLVVLIRVGAMPRQGHPLRGRRARSRTPRRLTSLPSAAEASSALQVVKIRMKGLLREVIGETVEDGADVDAEVLEVKQYLTMA